MYSLVTAVVQELLSKSWKRTLDFILVYIRYDWLLLGDNQKKVNQFLQLKCSLGPFIRGKIRRVLAKPRLILDEVCRLYGKFASYVSSYKWPYCLIKSRPNLNIRVTILSRNMKSPTSVVCVSFDHSSQFMIWRCSF